MDVEGAAVNAVEVARGDGAAADDRARAGERAGERARAELGAAAASDVSIARDESSCVCTTVLGCAERREPRLRAAPSSSAPGTMCIPVCLSSRMHPKVPHASYLTNKKMRAMQRFGKIWEQGIFLVECDDKVKAGAKDTHGKSVMRSAFRACQK